MASVGYMVSGRLNGKSVRRRFTERHAKAARAFAKTIDNPKIVYSVRIVIEGRQVEKSFRRKIDADNYAHIEEVNKINGTAVDPRKTKMLLGDYADRWLARRKDLAESTQELYEVSPNPY